MGFITLFSPLLYRFKLFHCKKNCLKKETKSRAQLPDTDSLTGLPTLPGTGSWGREGWSQCRRRERLRKNIETKAGPESEAVGSSLGIFLSAVTQGKTNCFMVWPIPTRDKEDVPSGSQGTTETCHPNGKMRRKLCQSNPLWVQNELTTPRPRIKNGVLLLEKNSLNNLKVIVNQKVHTPIDPHMHARCTLKTPIIQRKTNILWYRFFVASNNNNKIVPMNLFTKQK